jgi:adenylate cyclase
VFFAELKRRNVFRAATAYVAVAWLLIQVAEATFPAFGLSPQALRSLILLLAVGFVPAVGLSWAFEITPEGIKRDRDMEPGGELATRTNRLLDRGIVIVLALGLAYFALDKFVLGPSRNETRIEEARLEGRAEALLESYGEQSIAVLPFTNMSADPEQEYFGDGMAEEVLNLLARIPELRVISRSSAFTYKGKDVKLSQIAAELSVGHILEGSVRRAGNRIRVTAQLIEARSDTHLWSQTWDRELADLFVIQDEIAAEVVANLQLRLFGELPRARRIDPEAKLLFLQARQILDSWDHLGLERAYELLAAASHRDAAYAEPWTGLGWLYYRCYHFNSHGSDNAYCRSRSAEEWFDLSREAVDRALALDPGNPTANAYRAWNRAFHGIGELQAAADQFRSAIEASPPVSDVIRTASGFALAIRRPDQAIRLGEYGIARDPLCRLCLHNLGMAYLVAGRYAEAEQRFEGFVLWEIGGWLSMGQVRLLRGDPVGALEAFERQRMPEVSADTGIQAARAHGESLARRAIALHALGRMDDFRVSLATLESRYGVQAPDFVAEVHAWTGDLETASAWLERTLDAPPRPPAVITPFNYLSPFLQPVLALPRWQELLGEYGLADYQLAQIDFEFTLPGE